MILKLLPFSGIENDLTIATYTADFENAENVSVEVF